MIYFISDLHLSPDKPERTKRFRRFVTEVLGADKDAGRAVVYILGDFFDFWYESRPKPLVRYYFAEIETLRALAEKVKKIGILFGNRDFSYGKLLIETVSEKIEIIGDDTSIELGRRKAYLAHGDLLCRRDEAYQRFRRRVRSNPVRWIFRLLPWKLALMLIRRMQKGSEKHKSSSLASTLDIDEQAADDKLREGYDIIICGHVHNSRILPVSVDGSQKAVISLGDWARSIEYLVFDGEDFKRFSIEDDNEEESD